MADSVWYTRGNAYEKAYCNNHSEYHRGSYTDRSACDQSDPSLYTLCADKTTLPEFESAQMFEHYNVTDSTLKPVSCENYSIGIPSEFTQVDTGELSAQYYANSDNAC